MPRKKQTSAVINDVLAETKKGSENDSTSERNLDTCVATPAVKSRTNYPCTHVQRGLFLGGGKHSVAVDMQNNYKKKTTPHRVQGGNVRRAERTRCAKEKECVGRCELEGG